MVLASLKIDVLVLYSPEAMEQLLITSSSAMETQIRLYFEEVNLGNLNSEIPLQYNVVHMTEVSTRGMGMSECVLDENMFYLSSIK